MVHPLQQLRAEIEARAARIGAPRHALPTYGRSADGALPHVEVHGDEHHLVVVERGQEIRRERFTERDDLLFAVFREVTFTMASDWEVQHRTPGADPRRALFRRQQELLAQLEPRWAERQRAAHDEILRVHPFDDARASAIGRRGGTSGRPLARATLAGSSTPAHEHHVLLRSGAFVAEAEAAGGDRRVLGADLAGWLYARLLQQPGLGHDREPRLDATGGFALRVRCGAGRATLMLSCFAARERTWYAHVEARQPWPRWGGDWRAAVAARVRAALERVLADPCIEAVRWLDGDPWRDGGEPALPGRAPAGADEPR
jgi:hypothetical protein